MIGTDAPEQYEQREDIGAPRKRLPTREAGPERSRVQTPAPFEYERATSVEGAIAALARRGPEARIIAGGHSLLPMMKLRLANPEHLIDINELAELAYIREAGRRDPDRRADPPRRPAERPICSPEHFPLFRDAEDVIADPVVRNRGTIGGSLCQADAAEDLSSVCSAVEGERRDPRRRRRAGRRRWRTSTSAPT